MTRRPLATALVLAATLAGLVSCGIPTESDPHVVAPPAPVQGTTPQPAATPTAGSHLVVLYLIRDGRLVAVTRSVDQTLSLQMLLDALAATLSPEEQQQGFSSALAGTDVVNDVQVTDGRATVILADEGLEVITQLSQGLAIAQIVCTLDARDDVSSVVFEKTGTRISVPRGDGSQTDSPLTAEDYAILLEPD